VIRFIGLFSRDVVSVSRSRSRDGLETCFSKVSVSRNLGGSRSRSRLGLKTKRLGLKAQGLVYIPGYVGLCLSTNNL
jgi:hypothetical protein